LSGRRRFSRASHADEFVEHVTGQAQAWDEGRLALPNRAAVRIPMAWIDSCAALTVFRTNPDNARFNLTQSRWPTRAVWKARETNGMQVDVHQIKDRVAEESEHVHRLLGEIGKVIVGQHEVISRLLVGLLTGGHILLEGVPGLAKTTAIKSLAQALATHFQRIQFTPDLLPADLIGTMIYLPNEGTFKSRKGPIFSNFVLADEINRAPSKVQSALLEAMQERQVTIGEETFPLEGLFLVMATQNPIEQEGTYPLPEAQVDRFMLKVKITYPELDDERKVLDMALEGTSRPVRPVLQPADIARMQDVVKMIYIDDQVKHYILDLVRCTRDPAQFNRNELVPLIDFGASPRAAIFLGCGARAIAFLAGRGYVTPQDVKDIAYDVLRHRVILTYEAEAEQMSPEDVISTILNTVPVP
jgi:MoxR-like ATPase